MLPKAGENNVVSHPNLGLSINGWDNFSVTIPEVIDQGISGFSGKNFKINLKFSVRQRRKL
jgi:hypothetical protein